MTGQAGAPGEAAGNAPGNPGPGRLVGRLVALGVTGSIAAYKTTELVRLIQAEGADVVVLMTPSASRFVAPLALEALSGHTVESDVLALLPDGRIGHIVVADTCDAVVVAPATASWLGAMANGLAGDVITATCLATTAPVVVAPAMDGEMYAHPATRSNVERLRDTFGYAIVAPEVGPLASGQVGVGRLADLSTIVGAVVDAIGDRPIRAVDPGTRPARVAPSRPADLAGRHVVVTAGGTREPIDAVRFIGNRSTGRMGIAVADAALARGARVTVIAASVALDPPAEATVVDVETTAQLRIALLGALDGVDGRAGFDALVMAAAVADFTPSSPTDGKLPRGAGLTLELVPTPDLVAEVARIASGSDAAGQTSRRPLAPRPIIVGFAAEAGSLERAAEKLTRKGLDLLVANDVAEPGSGFGTETNRVTIFDPAGIRDEWPLLTKREVADRLLDRVARALDERDAAAQTGSNAQESSR